MAKKVVTEDDLRKIITQIVSQQGSQRRAALWLGVTQSYLNDVLRKRRALGNHIPLALGYERVITYRKREDV